MWGSSSVFLVCRPCPYSKTRASPKFLGRPTCTSTKYEKQQPNFARDVRKIFAGLPMERHIYRGQPLHPNGTGPPSVPNFFGIARPRMLTHHLFVVAYFLVSVISLFVIVCEWSVLINSDELVSLKLCVGTCRYLTIQ